jgi:UDP-glucose 4-epimerase
MNILILGANGYIGTNFINKILEGDNTIFIKLIDISEPNNYLKSNKRISFLQGDINEMKNIEDFFESVDIVFHFSGKSLVRRSIDLFGQDFHNDVCSTQKILNAMLVKNIRKIVFVSSGGTVYGNNNGLPIKENSALNPISSYGIVKSTIENILLLFKRESIIEPVIFRLSNIYGANYNKIGIQGVIPTFINKIKRKEEIIVFGTGEETRDYIHIDDFISLLHKILYQPFVSDIYNVGSGYGVTTNQIVEKLITLSGEKPIIKYIPKFKNDINNIILDISKVKEIFGWEPQIGIEVGIKSCWDSQQN